MKKLSLVFFSLFLFIAFTACDSGSGGVSVEDVDPGDLGSYTDNNESFSGDGQSELEGTAIAGEFLGDDLGIIMESLLGYDPTDSLPIPGASPVNLGLSRSIDAPTEAELDALLTDLMSGESVSETIKISGESVSLDSLQGDGAALDSGTLTMNASLTASGSMSGSETNISFSAGLDADVTVTGTDLYNNIAGPASSSDPTIKIDQIVLNAATENSISGNLVLDSEGTPSSGTVTVSTSTAVVFAMVISDINDGTTRIPSGKYIYSINLNESVSVDVATDEPTSSISATLHVSIYDNTNELVKEWNYSETDLETLDVDMPFS